MCCIDSRYTDRLLSIHHNVVIQQPSYRDFARADGENVADIRTMYARNDTEVAAIIFRSMAPVDNTNRASYRRHRWNRLKRVAAIRAARWNDIAHTSCFQNNIDWLEPRLCIQPIYQAISSTTATSPSSPPQPPTTTITRSARTQ